MTNKRKLLITYLQIGSTSPEEIHSRFVISLCYPWSHLQTKNNILITEDNICDFIIKTIWVMPYAAIHIPPRSTHKVGYRFCYRKIRQRCAHQSDKYLFHYHTSVGMSSTRMSIAFNTAMSCILLCLTPFLLSHPFPPVLLFARILALHANHLRHLPLLTVV